MYYTVAVAAPALGAAEVLVVAATTALLLQWLGDMASSAQTFLLLLPADFLLSLSWASFALDKIKLKMPYIF